MAFYRLAPDVPGELGEGTELDRSVHPPRVLRLAYVLDNWLGDDLAETFPTFLVTGNLLGPLTGSGLSGFEIGPVELTIEEEAGHALATAGLTSFPEFFRLNVTGTAGREDFGLTRRADLVVSDRALGVLRQGRLERCDIEEYDPAAQE